MCTPFPDELDHAHATAYHGETIFKGNIEERTQTVWHATLTSLDTVLWNSL